MKNRKHVALLIETSNAYARGLLEGVNGFVRAQEPWSIYLPEQERGATPPAWLARWKGDGIIARIETTEIAKAVTRTGLPTIDVSAARRVPDIPWVETNDQAIADFACQHLLERGFRVFGFCGVGDYNWSLWRQQHFVQSIENAGYQCHTYSGQSPQTKNFSWNREQHALTKWLEALPKPIGILACYDIKAQQLLDACREVNIAVPEQVAVLGVDNDVLLCDLSTPTLSSIAPNAYRAGYEAATLLHRMMAGEQVAPEAHLIDPLGVETRQSTDVSAIRDPVIADSVRFIREHACDGINVNDVVKKTPLSRRVFENRFRKAVGRTAHEEIVRVRINRVKQLLVETDLTLATIGSRTGFRHVEYLTVAFKRTTGVTPTQFRKENAD